MNGLLLMMIQHVVLQRTGVCGSAEAVANGGIGICVAVAAVATVAVRVMVYGVYVGGMWSWLAAMAPGLQKRGLGCNCVLQCTTYACLLPLYIVMLCSAVVAVVGAVHGLV